MHRRTKGILAAAFFIILFVVLPRYALTLLSGELYAMLRTMGFDLEDIILSLTAPGIALTILALLGGFAQPTSVIALITDLLSPLVWFYLFLFVITLGQPWTFGETRVTGGGGSAELTFLLDIRLFVALAAVILSLKLAKTSLQFASLRRLPPPEEKRKAAETLSLQTDRETA
ncbi:MAG: hypothetical protein QW057_04185 [Candidatus Bathyarchaeia archaeon]